MTETKRQDLSNLGKNHVNQTISFFFHVVIILFLVRSLSFPSIPLTACSTIYLVIYSFLPSYTITINQRNHSSLLSIYPSIHSRSIRIPYYPPTHSSIEYPTTHPPIHLSTLYYIHNPRQYSIHPVYIPLHLYYPSFFLVITLHVSSICSPI